MKAPPLWWRQWRWRRYAARHARQTLTFADRLGLVQPALSWVRLAVRWTAVLAAVVMAIAAWYLAIHLFLEALRAAA